MLGIGSPPFSLYPLAKGLAMITHICDRCYRPLPKKAPRYVVTIQVTAAATPLEITEEDLQQDTKAAVQAALEKAAEQSEAEAMRDIHVELHYDLCRKCQQEYLLQPMPPRSDIT
jgi:ribosomal protein L40E